MFSTPPTTTSFKQLKTVKSINNQMPVLSFGGTKLTIYYSLKIHDKNYEVFEVEECGYRGKTDSINTAVWPWRDKGPMDMGPLRETE